MKGKAVFATTCGNASLAIFATGTDGRIYYKLWNVTVVNTGWIPSQEEWISLGETPGGPSISVPCALTLLGQFQNTGSVNVFGVGRDKNVYARLVSCTDMWQSPEWTLLSQFESIVAYEYGGALDAQSWYLRDNSGTTEGLILVGLSSNSPRLKAFDSRQQSGFEWLPKIGRLPLGGTLIFEPAVASRVRPGDDASNIDIFGVGTDRHMYQLTLDATRRPPQPGVWTSDRSGCFNSPPAVACWSGQRVDVFALGLDNKMYHRGMENGGWIAEDWGDPLEDVVFDSPPAVTSWSTDRIDIVAVGTDGHMYHKAWDSGWLPWEDLN